MGQEVYVDERNVGVHMGRLGKSLKVHEIIPSPIRTIRGTGYIFGLN
ncbi:MAG: hypothetical protein MJK06_06960 [Hyphomicrobiales bacterium]|nr:hypothetical protein [Hyphomicrobiales bacterium]